MPQRSVVGTEP